MTRRTFSLILASQLAIVLLGAFLLWVCDVKLPVAVVNGLSASVGGIGLAVVTFFVIFLLFRIGGNFARVLHTDLQRITVLFSGCTWWHIFCIAILAGVGEELLFRGFFQTWLSNYLSISLAILAVSIVFGLLHYLSHAYFVCTLLISIAFGAVYYFSGSLLMVMVWHGAYDFIALVIIVKFPYLLGGDKVFSVKH